MANLLNRNIQVSRGKESESDSLSSGERKGRSPNRRETEGVEGLTKTNRGDSLTSLESEAREGESPVSEISERRSEDPE